MNPPDRPEVEKLCAGFSRLVQLIEAQMLIPTETTMKTWFNSNSDCNSPSIHTRTIRSSPVGSAPNHRCFIGPLQNHQVPRLMLVEFWPCSFSLLIGCWFDQITLYLNSHLILPQCHKRVALSKQRRFQVTLWMCFIVYVFHPVGFCVLQIRNHRFWNLVTKRINFKLWFHVSFGAASLFKQRSSIISLSYSSHSHE